MFKEPSTWPTSLQRVAPDGTVVGEFRSVGQWFKRFVRHLAGEERSFLFIDSRFSAQHLVPMRARNIHIVYVLHNIHVASPRLWSSDLGDIYSRLMGKVGGTDAFVTLTAPPAGRHRAAARPHLEPVRGPQPGRHARAQPGAARRVTRTG